MPAVVAPEFVRPTHWCVPPGGVDFGSGREAVALAAASGLVLDAWQAWSVEQILAERVDKRLAAFEAAVVVPRQCGKGTILEALTLNWLFLEEVETVLWSAHEFKTAAEAFRRMRVLLQGAPGLWPLVHRITTANGDEAIELTTGQRLKFVARSKASGRGFTGDKIILDEAFDLDGDQIAALVPTLATRPEPQVVYTSSAGMVSSDYLRALRDRGRAGGDDSLCWLEWCATPSGFDNHNQPVYDLDDREQWRAANPAFGIRISEEFIANERLTMLAVPEKFGRERLNIWDEPARPNEPPISLHDWQSLTDPQSEISAGGAVVFAAEIALDRRSGSIGAAGWRDDGAAHVELIDHRPGTDWLLPALLGYINRNHLHKLVRGKLRCPAVVIDPTSPAGTLVDPLRSAGVEPVLMTTREAAVAAAGLQDAITDGQVFHRSQEPVDRALEGAVKRDLGDGGWAFGRKKSGVDITPLVVVSNARWGLSESVKDYDLLESIW